MQMFRARCAECHWVYDAAVLPMNLTRAAKVMLDAHCPMCGNKKNNTVAEARALTGAEIDHKTKVLETEASRFNLCPPAPVAEPETAA